MLSDALRVLRDEASALASRPDLPDVAQPLRRHVGELPPVTDRLEGARAAIVAAAGEARERVDALLASPAPDLAAMAGLVAIGARLAVSRAEVGACMAQLDRVRPDILDVIRALGAHVGQIAVDISTLEAQLAARERTLKAMRDRTIATTVLMFLSPIVKIVDEAVNLVQRGELTETSLLKARRELDGARRRKGELDAALAQLEGVMREANLLTLEAQRFHNAADVVAAVMDDLAAFADRGASLSIGLALKFARPKIAHLLVTAS